MENSDIKSILIEVRDIGWEVKQILADMFSSTNESIRLLTQAESGSIELTEEQKLSFLTKYRTLKSNIENEWSKLPL